MMRKRIINNETEQSRQSSGDWLDLGQLAQVEITSEDNDYPIESALIPGAGRGWQASEPGSQVIRLLFDAPLILSRARLVFYEDDQERTQEFVLRWSADGGQTYREIVRQQYNFSPPATTQEVENYSLALEGVTAIELKIVPDISGGDSRAKLAELRLA
jgi:hypothetical protein